MSDSNNGVKTYLRFVLELCVYAIIIFAIVYAFFADKEVPEQDVKTSAELANKAIIYHAQKHSEN